MRFQCIYYGGRAIEQGQSEARNTLTKAEGSLTGLTALSVRCGSLPVGRAELSETPLRIPLICASRGGIGSYCHAPPIPAGSATANRHRMG